MSATLLRRTATVLTATAIAVPAFGALGGSAFAAQPAGHGNSSAAHGQVAHGKAAHATGAEKANKADAENADAKRGAAHGKAEAHTSRSAADDRPVAAAEAAKPAKAETSDPRGNNGTVFIHDVAGDNRPHNVPHVGCTFYVDFFGFDSDQVLSTSFVGQAPTMRRSRWYISPPSSDTPAQ